ncbi:MAG: hypothetical protein M0D57_08240 [Sphingobacteriales bacterium JAD_PAG50586_3]|nr:MAG: hypothetical protein M0D57_08240 [Sphingobacteriales bacterium JAD_PAG50586_3]
MKNLKYILSVLAIVFAASATFAQAAFEGEIRVTTSNKDLNETASVTWLIKGGNNKLVFNTVTKGEPYTYTIIIPANGINAVMLTEVQGKKPVTIFRLAALTTLRWLSTTSLQKQELQRMP